jgi:hypothetical protein
VTRLKNRNKIGSKGRVLAWQNVVKDVVEEQPENLSLLTTH